MIENAIEAVPKGGVETLSLPRCQITSLYHLDHLVIAKFIDLRDNLINSLRGCQMLQCLVVLNLDNNRVVTCEGLQKLDCLYELSLRNNCILL